MSKIKIVQQLKKGFRILGTVDKDINIKVTENLSTPGPISLTKYRFIYLNGFKWLVQTNENGDYILLREHDPIPFDLKKKEAIVKL